MAIDTFDGVVVVVSFRGFVLGLILFSWKYKLGGGGGSGG